MTDRSSPPLALADCAAGAFVSSASVRAYLVLTAAAGAAITALMLMLSVAANSGGEAERIAETQDESYLATFVSALAVNLSKPLR